MRIIQGGMGVGISHWRLARAVSRLGHLGVVSGTALDQVLARRLQQGDPGGHVRRALEHFPAPALAEQVWRAHYIAGGKTDTEAYHTLEMPSATPSGDWLVRVIVANFVEVYLAREGHDQPVGINYLEKIQAPHLASMFGAMLAGVDYVLMGAGIPLRVPGVLDHLARLEPVTYPLAVTGSPDGGGHLHFDPRAFIGAGTPPLRRPRFLAIVASDVLAQTLVRRASGHVDGFILEGPTAGGHNAPPRGALQLDPRGEPVYGPRDVIALDKVKALGRPFWLAGGVGSADGLRRALAHGAEGIQVGTAFAMCSDSGLRNDLRRGLLASVLAGATDVRTSPVASPTGFPFKVAALDGTLSAPAVIDGRPRICDLGYLREAYRTTDGSLAYRCRAEPVSLYVAKGGRAEHTMGRVCICNALMATAGFPQVRARHRIEPPIVTMGDDLPGILRFLPPGARDFSAADVVRALTAPAPTRAPGTPSSPLASTGQEPTHGAHHPHDVA
ncbi:MAG: nitronate monooxygenase [Vicinamibacterales bacterium]